MLLACVGFDLGMEGWARWACVFSIGGRKRVPTEGLSLQETQKEGILIRRVERDLSTKHGVPWSHRELQDDHSGIVHAHRCPSSMRNLQTIV